MEALKMEVVNLQNLDDSGKKSFAEDAILEINKTKTISENIAEDVPYFLRVIYDAWVFSGGYISGKRRNSVRQMIDLMIDDKMKSVHQKIGGKIKLSENDVFIFLTVIIGNWNYNDETYSPLMKRNGTVLEKKEIKEISRVLTRSWLGNHDEIIIPRVKSATVTKSTLERTEKIIQDHLQKYNYLLTISAEHTFADDRNPRQSTQAFVRIIRSIWEDNPNKDNVRFIWIIDYGSKDIESEYAVTEFLNIEALSSRIRALASFSYPNSDKIYEWFRNSAVFVVGSIEPHDIDAAYRTFRPEIDSFDKKAVWPWLNSRHLIPEGIPTEWTKSDELKELYKGELERIEEGSLTVFINESEGPQGEARDDKNPKYVMQAGVRVPGSRNPNEMIARGVELRSPGERYDHAYQIVCCAADYLLDRGDERSFGGRYDSKSALVQLRRMQFLVLPVEEFITLNQLFRRKPETSK